MVKVTYIDGRSKYFETLSDIFDNDKLKIVKIVSYYNYNTANIIPKDVGQLSNLQIFICRHGEIKEIPEEFWQLINLKHFECIYNNITVISNKICQLINLHTFECSYNNIEIIPEEICQLNNLNTFGLQLVTLNLIFLYNLHIYFD